VVFALPFERDFTLVGTTDCHFAGDPATVAPSADEIAYLCRVVSDHFRVAATPADAVWSFAGVRSLYDDGSNKPQDTPRDYVLVFNDECGAAPLLTVYGGKITTYRRLAEATLDRLAPIFGTRPVWTDRTPLPGGDFGSFGRLLAETRRKWTFLSEPQAERLVRAYGTRLDRVLGAAASLDDLGPLLGADLTAAEVHYLMAHEWAQTADDVLWRRSKLGLRGSRDARERLARFMADTIGSGRRGY
jgi:glycerol-3-phosphate dehydrogenase